MRALPALLAAILLATAQPSPAAADGAEVDIDNDRFVVGGSVRQSSPVDGDLFGMGGNVDLAAAVSGDAILAGGDVRVRDNVAQDLYAAGGNVRIEAAVGRNARMAGGNVEITSKGSIGGNLTIGAGTVEVRGPVGGYLQVGAGDVLVDSIVGGDVRVGSGELRLGPNARIGGRVVHRGPGEVQQDAGAQVAGGLELSEPIRVGSTHRHERRSGSDWSWPWTLALVALAGIIAGAFPAGSKRIGDGLRGDPGMVFLLGFILLVCIPIAALILMVTIIGIPLAIGLLALYFLMLVVGYAALAVVIGDTALAWLRSQDAARVGWRVGAAMLAMLALAILAQVPVLGGLVVFAAVLAGVGAVALVLKQRSGAAASPAASA